MGNTFFDSALKSVKINFNEIVKRQKEEKVCTYYLKKKDKVCGELFKPDGKFNRYCPKCNSIIAGGQREHYLKYRKAGKHGKSE